MARNQEKAQTVLARFLRAKEESFRNNKTRPARTEDCKSLPEAEMFRAQITRECSQLAMQLQNGALGEARIRELNDEFNRKRRLLIAWDMHCSRLGGSRTMRAGRSLMEDGAIAVIERGDRGHRGLRGAYVYIGAARELPGVKELLQRQRDKLKPAPDLRESRAELYRRVAPSYYGFRDEHDDELLSDEALVEKHLRSKRIEQWMQEHGHSQEEIEAAVKKDAETHAEFDDDGRPRRAYLSLPTRAEMQEALLQKRKASLKQQLLATGGGES